MKRILFAWPLQSHFASGGTGLAAWMLEALKREYRITILNWGTLEFDGLNRYYGTDLHRSDFEIGVIEPWIAWLASMTPTPMALLKAHYLAYRCRKIAEGFDAVIWPNNEADVGEAGIQYIHFPRLLRDRPEVDVRWWHRALAPGVRAYYSLSARLTGFSAERMLRNVTLVNSDFIGRQVKNVHGIVPKVVYPPAIGDFPEVPWGKRKNSFVCVGRVSPEKRLETVIDILDSVHQAEPDIHLHLVGNNPRSNYSASIRKLIERNASWITFHTSIPRAEVIELITANRYGIHGMHGEHFGMSVAEMVRGGCITFAHNSGGPAEILGGDARLLYDSPGDAVRKILNAIRDSETSSSLRAHLAARRSLFGTQVFSDQIREVVREFLQESHQCGLSTATSSALVSASAGGT